jgi:hypothetical protein
MRAELTSPRGALRKMCPNEPPAVARRNRADTLCPYADIARHLDVPTSVPSSAAVPMFRRYDAIAAGRRPMYFSKTVNHTDAIVVPRPTANGYPMVTRAITIGSNATASAGGM